MSPILFFVVPAALAFSPSDQAFKPERAVCSGHFSLEVAPAKAFPLFQPLGEKAWAIGWDPQPIFPADLRAEVGTMFATLGSKGIPSTWTIVRYDRNYAIEYLVVTPKHDVTWIAVRLEAEGARTQVDVRYTVTGLTDKGNAFAREHQTGFAEIMRHWQAHLSRALTP